MSCNVVKRTGAVNEDVAGSEEEANEDNDEKEKGEGEGPSCWDNEKGEVDDDATGSVVRELDVDQTGGDGEGSG